MKKTSILGMIWRPHIELEQIRVQPVVWLPLVILSILHIVGLLGATRVKTEEWPLNLVQTPPVITYSYMPFNLLLSDLFTFLLSICVVAFIVFGICKLFRMDVTITQALSLTVFLQVIPTFGLLLQAVVHLFEWDETFILYNLQDLLHVTSSHLSFVFGYVTIFVIWNWVVTAIGFRKVIGFSPVIAMILTWIVWYFPVLIGSLFIMPQG